MQSTKPQAKHDKIHDQTPRIHLPRGDYLCGVDVGGAVKTNKLVITKSGNKIFVMQFTEEEFEDIHSALGMAVGVVDKLHRDSPNFRRAIHKLKRSWATWGKDLKNREKQRAKLAKEKPNG